MEEVGELCKATWKERCASGELQESTMIGYLDHLKGLLFFRNKNGKRRTMRIMPRSREALLRWRDKLIDMRKEAGINESLGKSFVCCHIDGRPVTTVKHPWTKAREQADLENFHFHDLRHTYCSSIIMADGNLKTASDMIGHSSIKMTNRYTHLSQLAHTNMRQKLASYYDKMHIMHTMHRKVWVIYGAWGIKYRKRAYSFCP